MELANEVGRGAVRFELPVLCNHLLPVCDESGRSVGACGVYGRLQAEDSDVAGNLLGEVHLG